MSHSANILIIIRKKLQRQLYHEMLVNSGYSVYLCDDLANALLQLIMFSNIDAIILDTDFNDKGLEYFLRTLRSQIQWSTIPVLIIDTIDKGNIGEGLAENKFFTYTQNIDPLEVVRILEQVLKKD